MLEILLLLFVFGFRHGRGTDVMSDFPRITNFLPYGHEAPFVFTVAFRSCIHDVVITRLHSQVSGLGNLDLVGSPRYRLLRIL